MTEVTILLAIRAGGIVAQIAITFVAVRMLGAESFGDFIQLLVLTNLSGVPLQSGLTQVIARFVHGTEAFATICFVGGLQIVASLVIATAYSYFFSEISIEGFIFIVSYAAIGIGHAIGLGLSRKAGNSIIGPFSKQLVEPTLIIVILVFVASLNEHIKLGVAYIFSSLLALLLVSYFIYGFFRNCDLKSVAKREYIKSAFCIFNFSKISMSSHLVVSIPILLVSAYYSSTAVTAWRIMEQISNIVLLPHSVLSALAHRNILKVTTSNNMSKTDLEVTYAEIRRIRNIGLSIAIILTICLASFVVQIWDLLSSGQVMWESNFFFVCTAIMAAHLINTAFGHIGLLLGHFRQEEFMGRAAIVCAGFFVGLQVIVGVKGFILLALCLCGFNFTWNCLLFKRLRGIRR